MKKIIHLLLFFISINHFVLGQEVKKYTYVELVGRSIPFKNNISVKIDYGQYSKSLEDQRIRDENGQVKTFNSMIDALNYMGENGWELVQAYSETSGQENNNYTPHWILKRPLDFGSGTADLPKTKSDFQENQDQ